MIYLFWIIIAYLLWCLFFGAYAYEMIERYDVPYQRSKTDEKCIDIKSRIAICLSRLS